MIEHCVICGAELHPNAVRNGHKICIRCRRNVPKSFWNGAGSGNSPAEN